MAKKLIIENIFSGEGPTHIVQARVSHAFFRAIEAEAAKRGMTTSELLRNLVGIYFVPQVLTEKIQQHKEFDSRDREVIEAYRAYAKGFAGGLKNVGLLYEKLKVDQIRSEAMKLLSEEGDMRERLIDGLAERIGKRVFGGTKSKAGAQRTLKLLLEKSLSGKKQSRGGTK